MPSTNHQFERRRRRTHMSDRARGHAKIFSGAEDIERARSRDDHAALGLTEKQGSER
jgi:hypothetical protein